MASYNRVDLVGNLGSDPELRYTQSGKAVARFSIATNEGKRGTDSERTLWHRIVAWDKTAELVHRYLRKGSAVLVAGRLDYRTWTDRDGAEKTSTEIVAREVVFLGGEPPRERRRETESDPGDARDRRRDDVEPHELDEEIPF